MVYLIMAVLADGDSILADGLDSQGASAHVCLHQSVGLAVKISHLLALLMLQLERLLAVTRPFLSEAFTVRHCGLAIVASGLLTLTITVIGVFVEREFLYCQSQARQRGEGGGEGRGGGASLHMSLRKDLLAR